MVQLPAAWDVLSQKLGGIIKKSIIITTHHPSLVSYCIEIQWKDQNFNILIHHHWLWNWHPEWSAAGPGTRQRALHYDQEEKESGVTEWRVWRHPSVPCLHTLIDCNYIPHWLELETNLQEVSQSRRRPLIGNPTSCLLTVTVNKHSIVSQQHFKCESQEKALVGAFSVIMKLSIFANLRCEL